MKLASLCAWGGKSGPWLRRVLVCVALGLSGPMAVVQAYEVPAGAGSGASSGPEPGSPHTLHPLPAASAPAQTRSVAPGPVPAAAGRLERSQLGLVINTLDPYSMEIGRYYIRRRGLKPNQVLHVQLPVQPALSRQELERLRLQVEQHFGPQIQALALAWREPWAVECNSITSAVSLGFQAAQCEKLCGPGQPSPYFNHPTAMPFSLLGVRPSMLLAASDVNKAKALINRGVAADGWMQRRQAPTVSAVFARSGDRARDVRAVLFPQPGRIDSLLIRQEQGVRARPPGERLMLYLTGAVQVPGLEKWRFAPGAVADHLTSFGGRLDGSGGQMPATAWIDAGATASHGTVSEPCSHIPKFPQPQQLLLRLLEGGTVLEAYWKSVAWPAQSLFIGEPLAAPYGKPLQPGASFQMGLEGIEAGVP